ncbi:hypothetical protein OSTOST_10798, partial [Ostertagia ostertagi]
MDSNPIPNLPRPQTLFSPVATKASNLPFLSSDSIHLLEKIHGLLTEKAPEGIPLLEKFVSSLSSFSREVVEADKRQRSIVLYGVPEAEKTLAPSQRQAHTESFVTSVLDALDIETHPVEIYRMGSFLSRARKLHAIPAFKEIYIRKSMTRDERQKEKDLRNQARELNLKEHNGEHVYVVYKGELMKASDIPSTKKIKNSLRFFQKILPQVTYYPDVLCFDTFLPSRHRFLLIYRPPNSTSAHDEHLISIIVDLAGSVPFSTTVVGDLNLDIDWKSHTAESAMAEKFLSTFDALSLAQFVDFPTRLGTILDIVLAPQHRVSQIYALPPLHSSDHNIVRFSLVEDKKEEVAQVSRDFREMNKGAISYHIAHIDWMQ